MNKNRSRKEGMTLIEVSLAMGMSVFMCAGILSLGLSLRRSSEHSRIQTEARTYGKEALEIFIVGGLEEVKKPTAVDMIKPLTLKCSTGVIMERSFNVIWHDSTGGVVVAPSDADYGEVHVVVSYPSALKRGAMATNSFCTIVK